MNTETIEAMIDQKPIAAHEEAMRAGAARLAAARANLPGAQTAHAVAKADAEAAEAGTNDLDPMDADEVLASAERRLAVAERVLAKAEAALQATNAARFDAQGEAHKPVYRDGIARRLAAAAKADRGRALIAEAEGEFKEATAMLLYARGNGLQNLCVGDQGHYRLMGTAEEESKLWAVPNAWWTVPVAG